MKPLVTSAALGAVIALPLAPVPTALATSPQHGGTITEQKGVYGMTVKVGSRGKTGQMALFCAATPQWTSVGKSATFKFAAHGKFLAEQLSKSGKALWYFKGRFDGKQHFVGAGHITGRLCGASVPQRWSEGAIGEARMTSCPGQDSGQTLASNTPYTFAGLLPNAAARTPLRVEFVNPDGGSTVYHLTTDAVGNFTVQHTFPNNGEFPWGSSATPRYPDDPLSPGQSCGVTVL
jgi:hypothetical protein